MQQLSNNKRRALLQHPWVQSLFLSLLRHIEEPLWAPEVKDVRYDRDFQLSKNAAKDTEGWLADIEGTLLYTLGKNCKANGAIVEIGSWKGKSTIFLAKGSK
ncbi:MAG: hypothetical protein ACXV5H_10990, partial [Halobacteriota archaeon]